MEKEMAEVGSSIKKYYKDFFSQQNEVDRWHGNYFKNHNRAVGPRRRLQQTIQWISEHQSLNGQGIIFDLGCGAGITSSALEKLDYKIVALDQSFSMLEKAKVNSSEAKTVIDFLQGDIETLPFATESFDFVVCLGVITYLKSAEQAIAEITRILKPNGNVILSFLNRFHSWEYLTLPLRKIKHLLLNRTNETAQFDLQRYSVATIIGLFRQSGLNVTGTKLMDTIFIKNIWRNIITTPLAMRLNQYFTNRSPKSLYNHLGDMYLVKAEKPN